jgi:hypothetical protein
MDFTIESFKPGQRIQLHPACDRWMAGDKFGTVVRITRRRGNRMTEQQRLVVLMDRSQKRILVHPSLVGEIL